MSGSGSTCFGLAKSLEEAQAIASNLKDNYPGLASLGNLYLLMETYVKRRLNVKSPFIRYGRNPN